MTWLTRTPLVVVRASLRMINRLSAEEKIEGANVAAVGALPASDREVAVSRWERLAYGLRGVERFDTASDIGVKVVVQ